MLITANGGLLVCDITNHQLDYKQATNIVNKLQSTPLGLSWDTTFLRNTVPSLLFSSLYLNIIQKCLQGRSFETDIYNMAAADMS